MTHFPLGAGREFDRIRAIAKILGDRVGSLGDDCALVPMPSESGVKIFLALSTDMTVEGVHFRRDWLTLEEVGWRSAASALSDLAAEGAGAIGLLASVAAPKETESDEIGAVMRGIGAAAEAVGAQVLGGDLSEGPVWAVSVTVVGQTATPITRSGARIGDGIWVTGALGAARVALEAWEAGEAPPPDARIAFVHPEPRIAAGQWLAGHGARAMVDLSDGLASDAGHLAAASRVAIDVVLDHLPVAPSTIAPAARAGVRPQRYAAEGGEDYELLVALPGEFGASEVAAFQTACGLAITRIGAVQRGSQVRFRLGGAGVALAGFSHFA